MKLRLFFNVLFPIIIGFLIYLISRQHNDILLFKFLPKVNCVYIKLPYFVKFHLVDFLWSYSFIQCILFLYKENISISILIFSITFITLVEFFIGTFDIVDLWFEYLGILISTLVYSINKIQNK